RQELFPRRERASIDQGKAAGFDLAWPLDDAHHLPDLDPARRAQGSARRREVRYLDLRLPGHRLRHPWLPVRRAAAGGVCGRLLLSVVPVARADLRQLEPVITDR